jgi:hypothetical protein
VAVLAVTLGCGRAGAPPPGTSNTPALNERATIDAFLRAEGEAIEWIAAADPRLAIRARVRATDAMLAQLGTESVLSEDLSGQIRNRSLDLFAFRARLRALARAKDRLGAFDDHLPEVGPNNVLARPRLERELLLRLVDEETARAQAESRLGEASGDLVRGILSTWTPLTVPQDWPDRDAWLSKHLLDVRESLQDGRPRTGPLDLDLALYPLERLLVPLDEFPRGAAAIAEVRVTLDQTARSGPKLVQMSIVSQRLKAHLGVDLDPALWQSELEETEASLRQRAERALSESGTARADALASCRQMLFVEGSCPVVSGTRVRSMAPPPERAAICGVLSALADDSIAAAALAALHDDVLLALAAVSDSPPPRTRLLCSPEDDKVDDFRRAARERPVVALGVAFAARLLYGHGGDGTRLRAWSALGEAPLDIVARELGEH